VILCGTTLDFDELCVFLDIVSREQLTEYYSLLGDDDAQQTYASFFLKINSRNFHFLGAFKKPLSSSFYGKALSRIHINKNLHRPFFE